jgi:hypothetical protein
MLSVEKSGFSEAIAKLRKASNVQAGIGNAMEELCSIGTETIRAAYGDTSGTGNTAASVDWKQTGTGTYEIWAENEALLFLEFGAGVAPRTGFTPYPDSRPEGVAGIGGYGLGKGTQATWNYMGKDGIMHVTTGTRARCGFPQAVDAIRAAAPGLLVKVL